MVALREEKGQQALYNTDLTFNILIQHQRTNFIQFRCFFQYLIWIYSDDVCRKCNNLSITSREMHWIASRNSTWSASPSQVNYILACRRIWWIMFTNKMTFRDKSCLSSHLRFWKLFTRGSQNVISNWRLVVTGDESMINVWMPDSQWNDN